MTHRDPATQVRPKCDPDAPKMAPSDRDPATPSIGRGRGSRLLQRKMRQNQAAHRDPEGRTPIPLSENQLLALIIDACKWVGVLAYHTHDSRRSKPGFPDLVIAGSRAVLWRELKAPHGKLTADQRVWLDRLTDAGADADVWRPADWPTRVLAELNDIGGRRLPTTQMQAS